MHYLFVTSTNCRFRKLCSLCCLMKIKDLVDGSEVVNHAEYATLTKKNVA